MEILESDPDGPFSSTRFVFTSYKCETLGNKRKISPFWAGWGKKKEFPLDFDLKKKSGGRKSVRIVRK